MVYNEYRHNSSPGITGVRTYPPYKSLTQQGIASVVGVPVLFNLYFLTCIVSFWDLGCCSARHRQLAGWLQPLLTPSERFPPARPHTSVLDVQYVLNVCTTVPVRLDSSLGRFWAACSPAATQGLDLTVVSFPSVFAQRHVFAPLLLSRSAVPREQQ